MRKTILTALGAALISAATLQVAGAAERHHLRKVDRAAASQQFRNATDYVVSPSVTQEYYVGHGISAPAGRS